MPSPSESLTDRPARLFPIVLKHPRENRHRASVRPVAVSWMPHTAAVLLCKSPPMAKADSLASWNVEYFRNPDSRVDRVVDFLVDLGPLDVFALYEVEGKEVFDALLRANTWTPTA